MPYPLSPGLRPAPFAGQPDEDHRFAWSRLRGPERAPGWWQPVTSDRGCLDVSLGLESAVISGRWAVTGGRGAEAVLGKAVLGCVGSKP